MFLMGFLKLVSAERSLRTRETQEEEKNKAGILRVRSAHVKLGNDKGRACF